MIRNGVSQQDPRIITLSWWGKMKDTDTLEMFKLIIGPEEIENEASDTVSEYLMERTAFYGNKLGLQKKKIKEFDIVKDPMSGGYIIVFICERWFYG